MLLFEQNNPKIGETKNKQPIHGQLWNLTSVPANYIKVGCNMILHYNFNISQKVVLCYEVVLWEHEQTCGISESTV
jgi:hypothetical protein